MSPLVERMSHSVRRDGHPCYLLLYLWYPVSTVVPGTEWVMDKYLLHERISLFLDSCDPFSFSCSNFW